MLDIDHFKLFNDRYGHDVGDIVLKELAALILRHVRTEDIACRYGGEEFLLILPEVRLEIAKYRAEELRVLVHELGITYQGTLLSVTISIGVSVFPQHGHDLREVIHRPIKLCIKPKMRDVTESSLRLDSLSWFRVARHDTFIFTLAYNLSGNESRRL